MNEKNDLEEVVKEFYRIFLEREADDEGLKHYVTMIRKGVIKIDDLENQFKNSDEYKWLKTRWEPARKITPELNKILADSLEFEEYITEKEKKREPKLIFASVYNEESEQGGIGIIDNQQLNVIFEGSMCSGMFFDNENNILLGVTKREPQIIAFKIHNTDDIERIPVNFSNYIFSQDSHDIIIFNKKLYIIASNGEPNSKIATNAMDHWIGKGNQYVGKIIVSDINILENQIKVENSKIFNPFECEHHHHINDLCEIRGRLYVGSHSYCDKEKNLIKKGAVSILDENMHALVISDIFEQPHSLCNYKDRLFLCSSAIAAIFSIDLKRNTIRLEYKGINAYTRGLLVTDRYFYIGTSFSLGRTNSRFKNPNYGILQFNRDTGETRKISLPKNYDNVYSIISS